MLTDSQRNTGGACGDGRLAADQVGCRPASAFRLLIPDLDMPRLDGLGMVVRLRGRVRTASLPVVALTARHGEGEEKALHPAHLDCLTKPVHSRSIAARVRAVLEAFNT